jgi:hypothetical protein
MGGIPFALVFIWLGFLFGNDLITGHLSNGSPLASSQKEMATSATIIFGLGLIVILKFLLIKDFLSYTHYPIRFNRITRKVYVFRHNGPSGVVTLEWDKAYWFIGRSQSGSSSTYDLRCHVLDYDGIIRFTFAVGHFADTRAEILQHWEMIRRYMEESPDRLPFPPLAIVTSTEPTWRNCMTIQVGGMSGHSAVFMLMTVPWAFFRWISQKTCRRPVWPAEVEAVCQIPLDDPYRIPEPISSGEAITAGEEGNRALLEYRERARTAALAYELGNPEASDQ